MRDDDASRVILGAGGAETLPPRQFLAVVNAEIHRAVAFAPSDEEIQTFLHQRRVEPLPPPSWLGQSAPQPALQDDLSARVVESYQRTGSLSATQREIFGTNGGSDFYTIRTILSEAHIVL